VQFIERGLAVALPEGGELHSVVGPIERPRSRADDVIGIGFRPRAGEIAHGFGRLDEGEFAGQRVQQERVRLLRAELHETVARRVD
jgi:hypothetical protein